MANLDHVCLDNQSYYSLDVIEFRSELYGSLRVFLKRKAASYETAYFLVLSF